MEYLLKASAITAIFYIFYKLLLQRETFFESNRWFLLIGLLATICLPILIIPIYIENPNTVIDISAFTENPNITTATNQDYNLLIISSVYILGASFLFLKLIFEFVSLYHVFNKNKSIKKDGFMYIESEDTISPFSFFHFIVYNPKLFSVNELEHIINHEKVHVKHWHSIDTLCIQLATVVFWFNPLIWFYKKELQQNLEFIADQKAQNIASCQKSYQQLVLKATVTNHTLAIANNFYTSLIKKRIVMLNKSKSNKLNALKYVFVFPLLALFLMSFSTKEVYVSKNSTNSILTFGDTEIAIISKDFTGTELEKLTKEFKSYGVTLKFNGIKRNSKNEITAIKIAASSKSIKAKYAASSEDAIQSIKITFNSENDSITIGSVSNDNNHGSYTISKHDGTHKITKSGSGSNVFVIEEEHEDHNLNDVHKKHKEHKHHKIHDSEESNNIEVIIEDKGDNNENVYIIRKGKDGKEIKERINLNDDGTHSWIEVENKDAQQKNKTTIIESHKNENGMLLISSDGNESPLVLIDGKESTIQALEALDLNNIATMNVHKGDGIITRKYGERAKDGVILVITKK